MKKGKNNPKRGMMKKNNTWMFSQKAFLKKMKKTAKTFLFEMTGKRNPPKNKTKNNKCRILTGVVSGENNSHKVSANRAP